MTKKPPVFGPNGAVMNSDTMSQDLRTQYVESETKPFISLKDGLLFLKYIALCAIGFAAHFWLAEIFVEGSFVPAIIISVSVGTALLLFDLIKNKKGRLIAVCRAVLFAGLIFAFLGFIANPTDPRTQFLFTGAQYLYLLWLLKEFLWFAYKRWFRRKPIP